MNIRNARHAAGGMIDCEYNHPKFGWVPFTANPNDVEQLGRDLYAAAVAAGGIAPEPAKTAGQIAVEAAQAQAFTDAAAAKADNKLAALANLTPAQARAIANISTVLLSRLATNTTWPCVCSVSSAIVALSAGNSALVA